MKSPIRKLARCGCAAACLQIDSNTAIAFDRAHPFPMKASTHTVKSQDIERLLALVMERYRTMVATLETSLPSSDIEEARTHLRGMFGSITVESDAKEIRFVADLRETHLVLLRQVGGPANNVVAGARFGTYFRPHPVRIRLR